MLNAGLQIRVRIGNLFCLFLIENICSGYSKEPFILCIAEFNYFLYFSSKIYVVDTQKNRLNETVLLSIQNTCFKLMSKKKKII